VNGYTEKSWKRSHFPHWIEKLGWKGNIRWMRWIFINSFVKGKSWYVDSRILITWW